MEEGEDHDALLFFQTMDAQQADDTPTDESPVASTSTAASGAPRSDWLSTVFKDPRALITPSLEMLSWSQASDTKLDRIERLIMSRMSRQHTAQHIPIHTSSRRPDPFTRELLLD
ncbi:unnamed protein product, partial [Notodromas monacha]